jgi:two-component system, NarL family, sensor kinase
MKKFLFIFFWLPVLSSSAQNNNIDSLKTVLRSVQSAEDSTKTLVELCWEYRFINADTARQYGMKALELAQKNGFREDEVQALHNIGITHEAQGDYALALDFELKALEFRKEMGDESKTANTLNNIGIIYDEQGNYKRALEYYHEARKIYEKINDEKKIAMVLVNMAIVLKAQGEYAKVIEYYHEALAIYQRLNNEFGVAVCYANLGSVFYYLPNYESALHYSLMATQEFESQNIQQFLGSSLCNAGMAYDKLGDHEKAKSYLLKAKIMNKQYDNKKELSFTMIYLSQIYQSEGLLQLAEQEASEALSIASKINALQQVMEARLALSEIQAAKNDFKKAYHEYREYVHVKDSIYQQDKTRQIAQLQTEYETVKKENQILQLKQVNESKDARLNQSIITIILLVAILSGILAFGFLWKNRITLKQQAELQATRASLREGQLKAVIASQEEERKRFAADLHDGLGQMISALRLSLSHEKVDANALSHALGVLNDMNIEIRNIAFNLMPQVLMKSGLEEALKEFALRINRAGSVSVAVQTFDLDNDMLAEHRIALYRICQEWVNNVIKYSGGNQISIQLVKHPQELVLTIEDNGKGFDPNSLLESQGNGWKNINSRLHMIKGSIEIDTLKDRQGTTLIISVPQQISMAA